MFLIEGDQVFISQALVDSVGDAPITLQVEATEDGKHFVKGLSIGVIAAEPGPGVAELSTQLGEKAVELASVNAQLAEAEDSVAAMLGIISDSIGTMNVALGGAKLDVSEMTVESLLSTHATIKSQFTSRFPVGGVAALSTDDTRAPEKKADQTAEDAIYARRMAAVFGTRQSNQGA